MMAATRTSTAMTAVVASTARRMRDRSCCAAACARTPSWPAAEHAAALVARDGQQPAALTSLSTFSTRTLGSAPPRCRRSAPPGRTCGRYHDWVTEGTHRTSQKAQFPLASAFGQGHHVVDLLGRCRASRPLTDRVDAELVTELLDRTCDLLQQQIGPVG
jgi:hypothetical protein